MQKKAAEVLLNVVGLFVLRGIVLLPLSLL